MTNVNFKRYKKMKAEQNENSFEGKRDDELLSYQDEYIELSSKGLKINNYYFPLMQS